MNLCPVWWHSLSDTAAFGNIDCASLLLLMLGGIHKVVYVTMAVNVCVGKVSSAGNLAITLGSIPQ